MPIAQDAVIGSIVQAVNAHPQWRVVSTTSSLVRTFPKPFEGIMPALGTSAGAPGSTWLSLDFWVEAPPGRLGVFWRANPVNDTKVRNQVLKGLLDNAERTGFVYGGSRSPWSEGKSPAFAGRTASERWWPKGGPPELAAAREEVCRQLEMWAARVPAMVERIAAVGSATGVSQPPRNIPVSEQPRVVVKSPKTFSSAGAPRQSKPAASGSAKTPTIPKDIRDFRSPPHYTSIFEIYPNENRIYGTEDLYGDWNAEVLLMAKDAGSSRNFLPLDKGGSGWAWVHNPARPTNRNLIPLAEQLPCGKLYASFLGPLLRNDGQESGELVIDDRIRAFVRRVLLWTIASMPRLRTVAVLGQEAWRELCNALDKSSESARWKLRHLSGDPLEVVVEGRSIAFVALKHPARIPAGTLVQQPGWRWIVRRHGPD